VAAASVTPSRADVGRRRASSSESPEKPAVKLSAAFAMTTLLGTEALGFPSWRVATLPLIGQPVGEGAA
jgi:hypothetical protein